MIPNLKKPRKVVDRKYREWVRLQGCAIPRYYTAVHSPCGGPIDPHHVIPKGQGRMGSKVSDYRCVPLCRVHHEVAEQHPDSAREDFEYEIERLNKLYFSEHKPKLERKSKPRTYQKRVIHRGWAVLSSGLHFPVVETRFEAEQLAQLQKRENGKRGKIVRCQIRIEGTK